MYDITACRLRAILPKLATIFTTSREEFILEIYQTVKQLQAHVCVKTGPRKEQSVWDKALMEGAVNVDTFFDELNS